MRKYKPATAGLLQATSVIVYCLLIAVFMVFIDKLNAPDGGPLGIGLFLILLVLSAGITGLLVFGYPVYLALTHKLQDAFSVLIYTFLYLMIAVVLILLSLNF